MDDTINSGSDNKLLFLGISGVAIAAALIALLFAIKAKNENGKLADKLAGIESTVATKAEVSDVRNSAAKTSDIQQVAGDLAAFQGTVTTNFNALANTVNEQNKLITGITKGKPVTNGGGTTAPVAGAGEYAVKKGDFGTTIAKANGVSLSALTAANPGVNFSKLKIGQILKIPAKK